MGNFSFNGVILKKVLAKVEAEIPTLYAFASGYSWFIMLTKFSLDPTCCASVWEDPIHTILESSIGNFDWLLKPFWSIVMFPYPSTPCGLWLDVMFFKSVNFSWFSICIAGL